MKRVLALLLAAALFCCWLPTATVYAAAEEAVFKLAADKAQAVPGEQISFTVTVDSPACTQYGLTLDFDTDVFTLVSGNCDTQGAMIAQFEDGRFVVMYMMAAVPNAYVGTFTLQVKEGITATQAAVTAEPTVKNGSATVNAVCNTVTVALDPTASMPTEPEVTQPVQTEPLVTEPAETVPQSMIFDIVADKDTVAVGQKVTFTVTVTQAVPCTQYGVQLVYDADIFEMVEGTCTVQDAALADFNADRGFVVLYGMDMTAMTPGRDVGTFTLRVKEDVAVTEAVVTANPAAKNGRETIDTEINAVTLAIEPAQSVLPEVTEPTQTEPVETEPAETEPAETEPTETEPVDIRFLLEADGKPLAAGEQITFTLSVVEGVPCTQFGLQLRYDTDILEVVSGECSVSGAMLKEFAADKGFVVLYGNTPKTPEGIVGTFTLRVKDSAACTQTTVTLNPAAKNKNIILATAINSLSLSVAHTWDAGKQTLAPTCKDPGQMLYTCLGCGETKTESVPVTDVHSYGKWVSTDDLLHTQVCSVCGHAVTAAHNWDEGTQTLAPTCVDPGQLLYCCLDCGGTRTEEVAPTGIHTYSAWVDDTDAMHKKVCSVCEDTVSAPHSYSAWSFADGTVHTKQCADCLKLVSEDHTFGIWESGGNAQHSKVCGVCSGTVFADHSFDNDACTVCAHSAWLYAVNADGETVTVTGRLGSHTELLLPENLDGKTVTAIGANAFAGNTHITDVVIYADVRAIGENAFADCAALQEVQFRGTAKQWDGVQIGDGNEPLLNANIRFGISGEYTGDEIVNNDDVVYLLWHTLFPEEYPIDTNADFTGDEVVNNDDVVYLLWHTLFPEEYPIEK